MALGFLWFIHVILTLQSGERGRKGEGPSVYYLLRNCEKTQECVSPMMSEAWRVLVTVHLRHLDPRQGHIGDWNSPTG